MINKFNLLCIACFVGFIGDSLLQTGDHFNLGGPTGWGLRDYFKQHGRAESLFIAGGMMTLFYALFSLTNLPINYITMSIYGILLDLLFRELRIFPSLDGYYSYLNYFWSAFWEAFSMCLPLLVYKISLQL